MLFILPLPFTEYFKFIYRFDETELEMDQIFKYVSKLELTK